MKYRFLILTLLFALALSMVVAIGFDVDGVAFADECEEIEFSFDNSNGQTEYVGDNFLVKRKATGDILYLGEYDSDKIYQSIVDAVGDAVFTITIPSPIVTISIEDDEYTKAFSPVEHSFNFVANATHAYGNHLNFDGFFSADAETGYEWQYIKRGINGNADITALFGGTAQSVGFGGGQSHGEYSISVMATVRFNFKNMFIYATGVSESIDVVIEQATTEPDIDDLFVYDVPYGSTIKEILSSKNTQAGNEYWSLENTKLVDEVPQVGTSSYSVIVEQGSWSNGNFVKSEEFKEYHTTFTVTIKARSVVVYVEDIYMLQGENPPQIEYTILDALAPKDTIADLGLTISIADTTQYGQFSFVCEWTNLNYLLHFMSAKKDGSAPIVVIQPTTLVCEDDNFIYSVYRQAGFNFGDELVLCQDYSGVFDSSNQPKVLRIYNNNEEIIYGNVIVTITRKAGVNIDGVQVIEDGKIVSKKFDSNGKIVLNNVSPFVHYYDEGLSVDVQSLLIALCSWIGMVIVGFVGAYFIIVRKKQTDENHAENTTINNLNADEYANNTATIDSKKDNQNESSVDGQNDAQILDEQNEMSSESNTIKDDKQDKDSLVVDIVLSENDQEIDDTTLQDATEKSDDISQKIANAKNVVKVQNDNLKQPKITVKVSKEIFDKQNAERFASVGFVPTLLVEEAFAGKNDDDVESIDNDEIDDNDNAKITFQSKMSNASIENKAIYNALKNEILSYRGIKGRTVNGGDYFRRPGKQIVKIIFIGKTIRLALALNPADYDYNIYHQKDRSGMKKYADTPMFVKVQSPLGVRRAFKLIEDLMKNQGIKKDKKYCYNDQMYVLLFGDNNDNEDE